MFHHMAEAEAATGSFMPAINEFRDRVFAEWMRTFALARVFFIQRNRSENGWFYIFDGFFFDI